jgi:urease accessory protein
MEYLPQENIVFDGADGELTTRVEIQGSGLFIGWELTCLGRFESDELFEAGQLQQSLQITHDGRPLFNDRLCLTAPSVLQGSRAGFQNKNVFGTFVINADILKHDAESDTSGLSQRLIDHQAQFNSEHAGVSCLALTQKKGVFVARILGNKAELLRNHFEALWAMIRPEVLGRKPCAPRIWRT